MELKINFFSGRGNFTSEARRLEDTLHTFGRVTSNFSPGIAMFTLRTERSEREVREEVHSLVLAGEYTIAMLEKDDA